MSILSECVLAVDPSLKDDGHTEDDVLLLGNFNDKSITMLKFQN